MYTRRKTLENEKEELIMDSYWSVKKECATCEFWNGPREVTSNPKIVHAEPSAYGICCGSNKSNRGRQMRPGTSAGGSCWQKWHYLG